MRVSLSLLMGCGYPCPSLSFVPVLRVVGVPVLVLRVVGVPVLVLRSSGCGCPCSRSLGLWLSQFSPSQFSPPVLSRIVAVPVLASSRPLPRIVAVPVLSLGLWLSQFSRQFSVPVLPTSSRMHTSRRWPSSTMPDCTRTTAISPAFRALPGATRWPDRTFGQTTASDQQRLLQRQGRNRSGNLLGWGGTRGV